MHNDFRLQKVSKYCKVSFVLYTNTRGVQKVLQLNMMHKWLKQNYYVIIQHNHP